MMATKAQGNDAALTDELAGIIGCVRLRRYGEVLSELNGALRGAAEKFVARLADHLRYEEDVLFPALRDTAPAQARGLERVAEEHQLLRVHARDLAGRIVVHDAAGAYEVGRAFLAALFDHIDRESRVVDEIVRSLDGPAAARLNEIIWAREAHPRASDPKGPDLVDPACGC